MYQEPSIVHVQMGFTHRRESCGRGMWRFVKVGFKCDLVKYNIWEIFAVIKDESIFTLTVFFSRLHSFTGGSGWAKCQRGKNKPIYFHLYIGAYELQPLHSRLDICVCCRGSPKKKLFLTKWEKNWKKTRAFLYQDRWVWNKWTSSQTFQSFVLMSWGCSNCGAFKPPLFFVFSCRRWQTALPHLWWVLHWHCSTESEPGHVSLSHVFCLLKEVCGVGPRARSVTVSSEGNAESGSLILDMSDRLLTAMVAIGLYKNKTNLRSPTVGEKKCQTLL